MAYDSTDLVPAVTVNGAVSERLRLAKQLLLDKGWCQNNMRSAAGEFCSVAALVHNMPADDVGGQHSLYDKCYVALTWVIGCDSIPHWNDEPGRTKEQVLAAFDQAIAQVEGS